MRATNIGKQATWKQPFADMNRYFGGTKIQIGLMFLLLSCSAMVAVGNVSVFASGFNNPRGLKFGPDGYLYVAEGGAGGSANS